MNVPDVIAPDLQVLFVGVNPGLRSGETGLHFAHPSSRLWKALYHAGFTPRLLLPAEERLLLDYGLGLTNLVDRVTPSAAELSADELHRGAALLRRKACAYRPAWIAVLGVVAYRMAFAEADATVGPQRATLCSSRLWVLPGPTGRNAHYPIGRLGDEFVRLRAAVS